METKLIRVQMHVSSPTDTVINIQGQNYLVPPTLTNLTLANPQFYLDKSFDGKDILCTVIVAQVAPFTAVFNNAGGNYTVVAEPMPTNDYIGGHPKERPHY